MIPRYNHDKIREEFKQRCRKIGILHYHCGGYFFVKYILCIMRYFCVHNTARTSAPHIEMNFSTTIKDAIAKCFEPLYDQWGIYPNELATRAGAYSKIDYCLTYRYIFILQTAPLANIKNACYTETIKKHWRCPICPVPKEARTSPGP